MDRLSQLRGGAGGSRDVSLDGSAGGDSFLTATDSPSKYFSLSEDDSFDLAKDVTLSAPPQHSLNDDCLISNLSPIGKKDMLDYKIGKQIEAANILSGGVDIFDDNENSYDGNELVIDDNVEIDDKSPSLKSPESSDLPFHKSDDQSGESTLMEDIGGSKETEVVLQIDGKNVDAINIGNGLYLYRKEGQEELAAVQIIDDDQQQPSFKFLKVRENAEGNLEVYEEIEIEVPKDAPVKEGKPAPKSTSHVPIKDINKVISDPQSSKVAEKKMNTPEKETPVATPKKPEAETSKDAAQTEGKLVKISESRKSPLMAYHSTPNKEGIPLTKTMVDQQLHPSRHSDNIKKTIEVHTDSSKQRISETPTKSKEIGGPEKYTDKPLEVDKLLNKEVICEKVHSETIETAPVVVETKSNEVLDSSNKESTVDKKDKVKKQHVEVVKQLETSESASSKEESKLPVENKRLEKEDLTKVVVPNLTDIVDSLEQSAPTTADSLKTYSKIKVATHNPVNTTEKDKCGASKDKLIESKISHVKFPENPESKENPTEIIESGEMENDENVLIIEEDTIDISPQIPAPKEKDAKQLATSSETKLKVVEDQMKKTPSKEENEGSPKILSSIESKEKKLESTVQTLEVQKSLSTSNITKEIPYNLVDNSKKKLESKVVGPCNSETDVTKTDNTQIEDSFKELDEAEISVPNLEVTVVTVNTLIKNTLTNLDKTEMPETKQEITEARDTQIKDTVEKMDNTGISKQEVVAEKNIVQTKKPSTEIKSSVNSISSQMKDSVSTSYKQQNVISKVDNTPQYTHNSEKNYKTSVNDFKMSTPLPNKDQSQINLLKNTQNMVKPIVVKLDVKPVTSASEIKTVLNHKSDPPKTSIVDTKPKSINNNHAPVPFGKWTEVNRQDFLNKIKESKVPVHSSNTNQLKQPNDLNRRDVLKKIDSQRHTYNVKVQESLQKSNVKTEAAFTSKTVTKHESKAAEKSEAAPVVKPKPIVIKKPVQETVQKVESEPPVTVTNTVKPEPQRKEINNQALIDKTIEGIINRPVTGKGGDEVVQAENSGTEKCDNKSEQLSNSQPTLLDAIEIKMNELHGIPFVERPPHELPRPCAPEPKHSIKTETVVPQKVTKIPNLLPLTKTQQKLIDCEDEIMKHEPAQEKVVNLTIVASKALAKSEASANAAKKDKIITENEFDKFARRNSVTYENCLTVTDTQQVIQTVVPRDAPPKKISRNEQMLAEAKAKSPHKHPIMRQYQPSKGSSKYADAQNKHYQSKVQMAYQTALTAKRRIDSPITILEDKPVKVVYMEPSTEFTHLNVQGRDLSPAKRLPDPDTLTVGTCDSLDSEILDAIEDVKVHDDTKTKSKHQRKQVLTPVETPDLELIEPGDLGIEVSPKKKRKTEPEKSLKNLVPKKSYLLGRSAPRAETPSEPPVPPKETVQPNPVVPIHNDAVSAIDSLVKAAELLENQSESLSANISVQNVDSAQSTPVKRGRGRPRKNPLPDGSPAAAKAPSPQKKPRLEAKPEVSSSDDSSDDEALIKENWTMGKINENIVCPICSKLFRSENVVFKHVKHCTGPSPSRSDPDKRSPRRRSSRESDKPRVDLSPARNTPRKRKSKDSGKSTSSDDVVPIESAKETEKESKKESQKPAKTKLLPRYSNLVCEICGKSFRQLSYLVSHKLQHKKDETRRAVAESQPDKSIFSCETCKKEFRKLHHLVQHRLIHNPVPSRTLRKSSSEQKEIPKGTDFSKAEDPSAAFRCEPCDKSFRKLHHLVEHRETHDGINRQRSDSVTQLGCDKPTPPPQCEICKKTFRKLHHLIEHKEQHVETSSEKSDDQKSVKSSLSTKDIIHECNLCYMVFPNEHSLTKHTVICLRKKRQSAAKQAAAAQEDKKTDEDDTNVSKPEETKVAEEKEHIAEQPAVETNVVEEKTEKLPEPITAPLAKVKAPEIKADLPKNEKVKTAVKSERRSIETKTAPVRKVTPTPEVPPSKPVKKVEVPPMIKEVDEVIVIEDTPKKKMPAKEKVAPSVTKRQKAAVEQRAAPAPPSDDDEVRYMFNPDFKMDETAEGKNFMKVRAKKRSSLQIERPNSKDLVRRRSLLQHPPKIPRLRAKSDDTKAAPTNPPPKLAKPKLEKIEQVPSTDSDDSDVKYSFPKTVPEKPSKQEPAEREKVRRKTMAEKRKSLSGIAKRKSLGKSVVKPTPEPPKAVKRRTMAVEHRCDCGQLFSSAALLARHTSLAHTPPRRRRDKPADSKAAANKSASKSDSKTRNRLHGGVPLPEKRAPRK